ncbi:hypothetical protein GAY33_05390 [Azospirillum brasilense]|uniref:hypothetical protein n=1 Tax=Azospirillum argentinense TaxID=2970906 RepID=UPI00190CA5D9|nr:hypothetical protein [Azospirillum argentinense]MBK3798670.1 hypothetical protein [Azospirillum argentinense]
MPQTITAASYPLLETAHNAGAWMTWDATTAAHIRNAGLYEVRALHQGAVRVRATVTGAPAGMADVVFHPVDAPDGAAPVTPTLVRWTGETTATVPQGVATNAVLHEIAHERCRQDAKWGGPSNDDLHATGTLAIAGAVYALNGVQGVHPQHVIIEASSGPLRPLSPCGQAPSDLRTALVRAAACIVAEIERLDRAMVAATTPTDAEIEALMADDGSEQ